MTFWGLADYQVNEIIEVFADREDAESMLCDCLSDEPEWAEILIKVVPVEHDPASLSDAVATSAD
jgi:hypothetical protein